MLEGAIELLPFTSPRHTPLDDKAFSLTYFRGLVSLAMAAALQAGRPLEEVVEIVEHGRGIIFGNRFQIQADIARVRDKNHQLAEQYEQVRDAIDAPEGSGSLMKSSQRREALRGELQCVIEQIRALGFDDFPPGPTPATRLIKAAELKPIIIVNGNNIRSDALVLKGSDRGLIPIRLPKLRHSQVHEMADKLRRKDLSQQQMFDLLKWLWDCIVRPIFTTPGILESPENGGKPHVRWIPLGPLGALPIHAAGDYFCESSLKQTALDYAFSSYVPSIKALLYSQDSRPHREVDAENEKFLLVSMENTDGHAPLPYARKEINLLAGKLPADRRVVLHSPSSLEVSHALRNSRIFHFAGHGFSHPKEPLQSSLLLNDQPLTVGDILNVNTNKAPPFLAFLSACSTGTSRRVEDEGIHLMSAFQLIGYRHVIGSLWELSDEHCVHVAGDVYDHLIASGTTDDSVCHALHRAVMRLRHGAFGNSSNRTSRELAADCEEEDSSWWNLTGDDPRIWAAYIHMGL
jgi:CHAT domain-containing protein